MKAKQDLAHLLYSNNLSIKNKILFYKIVLRPILLYASPVWGSAAKTHFKRLQTFQNKTLQAIQKAPWYFSTEHWNQKLSNNLFNRALEISDEFYDLLEYDEREFPRRPRHRISA